MCILIKTFFGFIKCKHSFCIFSILADSRNQLCFVGSQWIHLYRTGVYGYGYISMDIHAKSVDMDMDGKFHIHGNPGQTAADNWTKPMDLSHWPA